MLELVKIKYNKETKEESLVPLFLYKKDITCLYRDRNGVFVVTAQGFIHKVPLKLKELQGYVGDF